MSTGGFCEISEALPPIFQTQVVPIDLNANGKTDKDEDFYANLDLLIQKLETGQVDLPPVGKMLFIYKEDMPEV